MSIFYFGYLKKINGQLFLILTGSYLLKFLTKSWIRLDTKLSNGKCSKFFPKQFQDQTVINEDGFSIYRRRDTSETTIKNDIELDNKFVVPHNVDLTVRYQAHINVEICSQTKAVKYLFKYINKGPDRMKAVLELEPQEDRRQHDNITNNQDEIKAYLDCRYLFAYEVRWRLFEFDIHHREPAVQRLLIHLRHEQNIYFADSETILGIIHRSGIEKTMFTEWMLTNQSNENARHLLYTDFPTEWVWYKNEKKWKKRQSGRSIGKLIYIHPAAGELYYMRLLLNETRGSTCYEDLKTVNGMVYSTFQEACEALGLLGNDQEWTNALPQASEWATPQELRQLFVTIIMFCEVGNPEVFFEKNWRMMVEDIEHGLRRAYNMPTYVIPKLELRNYLLVSLELLFNKS